MVLQDLTQAELIVKLEAAQAKIEALAKARQGKLTIKVSTKGAISIYGMGRWPVTLYRSQAERLFSAEGVAQVKAFIEANSDQLAVKE